jgi:trk system potassium uptake protein
VRPAGVENRAGTAAPPRGGLLRRPRLSLRHPAQFVTFSFAAAILVAAGLLMLPVARDPGEAPTSFTQALFTATSAICVTGLTVVDTASHWSTFGEALILAGIQAGGFGFMTTASLLGLLVARRLGLRTRLVAAAETNVLGLGDVRRVLVGVAVTSFVVESAVAVCVGLRMWVGYDQSPGRSVYLGVFHAVSSFNNAGFGLYSDNLVRFGTDPWVTLPLAAAVMLGAIGFPVLFELRRSLPRPSTWSVHTKITLLGSLLLWVGGTVMLLVFEWGNPRTLGRADIPGKLLLGFAQGGVWPRTAGFNSVDMASLHESSLLVTDVLMFIGGGSGSTAGGIKVTTFFLLFFAIVAEVRGDETIDAFHRRIPPTTIRLALTVALLGVAAVVTGTLALLTISHHDLDPVLFEVVSAFGTVGLSTGITPTLPTAGHYVLIALMFVGRIGPVTAAAALALRGRRKLYRFPVERPIVG